MLGRKGQLALEYMSIVAVLLVAVAGVFSYSVVLSQASTQFEKTKNSAKSLENGARTVYGLGPGSALTVEIELPSGVDSAIIGQKAIGWNISFLGSTSSVFFETDMNVVGYLPTKDGKHFVRLQMEESGIVRAGTIGLNVQPDKLFAKLHPGEQKQLDFNAINNSGTALSSVTSSITGNAAAFLSVSGLATSIALDANDAFTVTASSSSGQAAGIFSATLEIDSNEGYNDVSLINVEILKVLKDVNVVVFSNEAYSTHASSFYPGDTVYYEIRLSDQTGNPVDTSDLNVTVKDDDSETMQSEKGVTSSNGKFQSSYALPCNADDGTWSIAADANFNKKVSDSNNFTVQDVQQQSFFSFDWNTASFDGAGKKLENWTIENNDDCQSITITKMKVTWTNDNDNAKLKKIKLNNQEVWSGTKTSGSTIILDNSFAIAALTSYSQNNKLEFDERVDDDGETFQIEFTFSDNSAFTTPVYSG